MGQSMPSPLTFSVLGLRPSKIDHDDRNGHVAYKSLPCEAMTSSLAQKLWAYEISHQKKTLFASPQRP